MQKLMMAVGATIVVGAASFVSAATAPSWTQHVRSDAGVGKLIPIVEAQSGNSSPQAITTVSYNQTSTTGLNYNSGVAPDTLDDVNLAPGTVASGSSRLDAALIAVAVLPGTAAQNAVIYVDFYDTFSAAGTSTTAANYLGGFGGTVPLSANSGTGAALSSFSFTNLATLLSTKIDFNDDNLAVEVTVANAAGNAYSTVAFPVSSTPGVPTVGTSVTGVYRSPTATSFPATGLDVASGNLYLRLSTATVPEPTTLGALAGIGAIVARRRRA